MPRITVQTATDPAAWDAALQTRRFSPFLQSWSMGQVYQDIGQEPIRLEARSDTGIVGLCFGHVVPAKRGRHLSVPYGPLLDDPSALEPMLSALRDAAVERRCAFIRLSPFIPAQDSLVSELQRLSRPSPLHLLAEHLWYLPLWHQDLWTTADASPAPVTEDLLLSGMRSTARNLIRRAAKEGVTVEASDDPVRDLPHFLALHEETRKRHGFTPYTNAFFEAQVRRFAPAKQAILYLARYQGEVIASSIHMHFGRETSYHHGASTQKYRNIPASYLLQWTAIRDALHRGDAVYNFWGVSPEGVEKHPFAGVRTFKTAFGGTILELMHCADVPLTAHYHLTRAIETFRKWKRGF